MTDISKEDKKFLDGIYGKIRYLEYLKIQDDIVKENCNKIKKRNTLLITSLMPILILIIFVVRAFFTNPAVMLILCISMLSLGSCYQYIEENVKHEAYNK